MTLRPTALLLLAIALLPAVDVPAPPEMPDAQTYVVAVVPDLRATIAHVEAAAGALGVPLPPGLIAGQLGMAFNDPQLANLGAGPIVVVLAPGVPIPAWACIVPSAHGDLLAAAVARMNMSAEAVDGAVVIAKTIDGVALGKALAPKIASLAPAAPAPDIRLLVAGDRLATTYLPFLLGVLQNAPHRPGQPAPDPKVMALVGAIMRNCAAEAGRLQVDLDVDAAGLRAAVTAAPKPDGVIARSMIAPLPAGPRPLAARFGAGAGHVVMAGRINPAVFTGMADLLATLAADPAGRDMITPDVVQLCRDGAGMVTGEIVMTQGVGGSPMAQETLYGITDPAKAAAIADRAGALFAKGPLAEFYASLGMTVQMDHATRKGPAGERIDRMTIQVDPAKAPPGAADVWARLFLPTEIGFGADALAIASEPAVLDALLGAGRGPCILAAEHTIGAGWDGYIDYDIGKQLHAQAQMMTAGPAAQLGAVFAQAPTGNPVAMAWAIRDGRMRLQVAVPMALAKDLKDFFAKQQMQQRQNRRGQAPPVESHDPPAPDPMF